MATVKAKCVPCKGTGVYEGYAEPKGVGVVCTGCKGTGSHVIHYDPAEPRGEREGIVRVVQVNCSGNPSGGQPYRNWLRGVPFPRGSEDRERSCPAWWNQNTSGPDLNWDKCAGSGAFMACKHYPDKAKCWRALDEEDSRA